MNTRMLHLFLAFAFTSSVFAPALAIAANAEPDAKTEATGNHNQAVSPNTEAQPLEPREARIKKIEAMTPFILVGIFSDLPEKPAEAVQLVDGFDAFREKMIAESITVWPIAKFASALNPPDEAAFRRALCSHAGKLGADYVVIITDKEEIKVNFQPRFEKLVYCAYAYKRITALLGIDYDQEAKQNGITKISGFMKGSLAKKCGLQVGDVIKKVDGIASANRPKYWNKLMRSKPGDKVKVEVEREGKTLEFKVELTAG